MPLDYEAKPDPVNIKIDVKDEIKNEIASKIKQEHNIKSESEIKSEFEPRVKVEMNDEVKMKAEDDPRITNVTMDGIENDIMAHLSLLSIPQLRARLYQEERHHLPQARTVRHEHGIDEVPNCPIPDQPDHSEEYGNTVIMVEIIQERVTQLMTALFHKLKAIQNKHTTWSNQEYIHRFETGDMDYSHFRHHENLQVLQLAYIRAIPDIAPPSLIYLAAAAAHMCLRWDVALGPWDRRGLQGVVGGDGDGDGVQRAVYCLRSEGNGFVVG